MLDGAIAHVLSQHPDAHHNLPFVSDLLIGLDPDTGFADPDRFKDTIIAMRMNNAAGGLPQKAASTLDELGEKIYGSVMAELQTALKWVSDPAMRGHLSGSDFTFASLGDNGPAAACMPPRARASRLDSAGRCSPRGRAG